MIHFEIFWDYKWLNVVCLLVTTQFLVVYSVFFSPRCLIPGSLTLNQFAWNVLFKLPLTRRCRKSSEKSAYHLISWRGSGVRQHRIECSSSDCVFFIFQSSHICCLHSLHQPVTSCANCFSFTPMFGLNLVSLACLHVIQLIVLHMFTLSDLLQPDGAYM